MKLLLTSAGFTNRNIAEALLRLAGVPASELRLAFIPTAANIEPGDKDWLINDFVQCRKVGFSSIDIVDIAGLPGGVVRERLEAANVILIGGGNDYYLMYWLERVGLSNYLPELLQSRVYVGISAGSIVTGPDVPRRVLDELYTETVEQFSDVSGRTLYLVDFYTFPHLNSVYFPRVVKKNFDFFPRPSYILEDGAAVVVDEDRVEMIGKGAFLPTTRGS